MDGKIENGKKTIRADKEKKILVSRLNRIAGQINGIARMIENDAYCIDILMQTSAAQSAVKAFSRQIIEHHLKACVSKGIRQGDDSVIDELSETLFKFIK